MSGGHYDYAYKHVQEFADQLLVEGTPHTVLRSAFREHLEKVAEAMKAVEWVDSSDTGPGSEVEAIRECLPAGFELAVATERAKRAKADLETAIGAAKGPGRG